MSWKTALKAAAATFGVEIKRSSPKREHPVVSLRPESSSLGNVLLSHSLRPFLLKEGEAVPHNHAGHWRGLQVAKTFLDLNYSVDVIDYHDESFIPEKEYSFFIDSYVNLERIAPMLNPGCFKIMHIQTAHWAFHNSAEYKRHSALLQRRGVCLKLRRQLIPHWAIEHADCGTIQGNSFTRSTYAYANKPLYPIPMASPVLYPWPETKRWDTCRKRFLWFGNHGLIHKGLDLVLEAFAQMPEYHLTVCGPIERDSDFVEAFHDELYHTPNIHTAGWIDNRSDEFIQIANNCVGTIYTTCSEGGGGSAIACMHAGLIPVVSYESSVDVHDFGVLLRSCSIEDIRESIRMVGSLPILELKERARKAWEFARAHHTRKKFIEEYRKVVIDLMAAQRAKSELGKAKNAQNVTEAIKSQPLARRASL